MLTMIKNRGFKYLSTRGAILNVLLKAFETSER